LARVGSRLRSTKGTHWLIAANGVTAATGAVQALAVARLIGATEFGRVALAVAVPQLAFGLAQPRTAHSLLALLSRAVSTEADRTTAAASTRLALVLETGAAVVAFGGCAAWFTFAPPPQAAGLLRPALLYSASLVARASVSPLKTTLLAIGADRPSATTDLGFGIVQLTTGLLGVLWTKDASGYLHGSAAGNVIGAGMYAVVTAELRRRDGRTVAHVAIADLKRVWRESHRFIVGSGIGSAVSAIVTSGDVIFLSRYLGPADIGHYRLAARSGDLFVLLSTPLSSSAMRTLGTLPSDDRQAFRRLIRTWALRRSVPALFIVACCSLAVRPAFLAALGRDFDSAASAAVLFVLASGVWLVGYWVRPAYLMLGRPLLHLALFVVSVLISLPFLPHLAERHMVTGAATWFLIWNVLQFVLSCGTLAWLLKRRPSE
jgi:O-antigen/teichoic acid export membrane protein